MAIDLWRSYDGKLDSHYCGAPARYRVDGEWMCAHCAQEFAHQITDQTTAPGKKCAECTRRAGDWDETT